MINRSEMFKRAHLSCRLKHFWHKEKPYREVFASCLRYEYEQARQRASWAAKAAERQALRDEQNLNGIPVASCLADRGGRSFYRTSRFVAAVGE